MSSNKKLILYTIGLLITGFAGLAIPYLACIGIYYAAKKIRRQRRHRALRRRLREILPHREAIWGVVSEIQAYRLAHKGKVYSHLRPNAEGNKLHYVPCNGFYASDYGLTLEQMKLAGRVIGKGEMYEGVLWLPVLPKEEPEALAA